MRKFIYIAAWLFSLIFVIGFTFIIFKLPGGFYLLYTGQTAAVGVFFPILFYYKWKDGQLATRRIFLQWLSGQVAAIIFVASTYIRLYDYRVVADFTLFASFLLLLFGFLPLLFYNMYQQSLEEI